MYVNCVTNALRLNHTGTFRYYGRVIGSAPRNKIRPIKIETSHHGMPLDLTPLPVGHETSSKKGRSWPGRSSLLTCFPAFPVIECDRC